MWRNRVEVPSNKPAPESGFRLDIEGSGKRGRISIGGLLGKSDKEKGSQTERLLRPETPFDLSRTVLAEAAGGNIIAEASMIETFGAKFEWHAKEGPAWLSGSAFVDQAMACRGNEYLISQRAEMLEQRFGIDYNEAEARIKAATAKLWPDN